MRSDLCDVLEIDVPILSAPMAGAVGPDLIAAVCEAGGMGVLPLWTRPAAEFRGAIADVRTRTGRNFAVNLNVSLPYQDQLRACIEEQVFAVSLFWGVNGDAIHMAKSGGLVVLASVGSAAEAKVAADAGADVIVAQGWEAGGHVWGQVSTMALVPAVADAVSVPVVAAGGIADGRGVAAAQMLGASGVWIGTRFLASREATIHETYQHRILEATESQTEWYANLYDVGWPDAPHRSLANSTSRKWRSVGSPEPGSRPDEGTIIGARSDGQDVVKYQSHTPHKSTRGDIEAMSLWAGQGVSLVRQVMPVADIMDEITSDALRIMKASSS